MKVNYYSLPKASKIYWFKHDNKLEISRRFKMLLSPSVVTFNNSDKIFREKGFTSKLCIFDVNPIDFNAYRCQVVNMYGSVEFTFLDHWIGSIFYQYTNESPSTKINTIIPANNEIDDAITHVGMLLLVNNVFK